MSSTDAVSAALATVRFLNISQVAASLNVSDSTVGRMIRDGQLGAVKLRSRLVVPDVAMPGRGAPLPFVHNGERRTPMQGSFLPVRVVAGVFCISRATLYRMIREGEFPGMRVRGRVVVPEAAIGEMVDRAVGTQSIVEPREWAEALV